MHEISDAPWGIEIDLSGEMDAEAMESFYADLEAAVRAEPDGFNIYADHRGISTLPDEAAEQFGNVMEMCKENGLDRSVVIMDSAITKMQQDRLKQKTGIDGQKVLNAGRDDDWEEAAEAWVTE